MHLVFLAALSFLSVIGVIELLRQFIFWLFRPECPLHIGATLHSAEEAEYNVRGILQRMRWMRLSAKLILVDRSGDPQLREIVEALVLRYDDVTLLPGGKVKDRRKDDATS